MVIYFAMPRAPTTTDAFSAIAEPKRREILGLLVQRGSGGEGGGGSEEGCDVSWLVAELGWPQPQVSKHLGVLREVGLVSVIKQGRRRVYTVNSEQLRPVYDWVKTYEKFWDHRLHRIKDRAELLERQSKQKK